MTDHHGAAPASTPAEPGGGAIARALVRLAEKGNRLPDPLTLFVILTALVVLASVVFAGSSADVTQRDGSVQTRVVQSLLTTEGIRWMFLQAIPNFINFAPLGPVLTVMLGIGVAERSGLIAAGLRALVRGVPSSFITAALVFGGVMSSMAADAGYVVLTPLGAVLFAGLGRHPLAGLAAAFAGVSGGFSANLLITGLDPMLSGLTDTAAKTIDPAYSVNATANYYFMFASVFLVTAIGTLVTTRFVEPMLGRWNPEDGDAPDTTMEENSDRERGAFRLAMIVGVLLVVAIALLAIVPGSPLRDPIAPGRPAVEGLHSFFESIELLILVLFIIPGILFGIRTGRIRSDRDVASMTADSMAAMGGYVVLAFVAGQFVAFFNRTELGAVTAVHGATLLRDLGLGGIPLLLAFIVVTAAMNFLVGSASAKWAFMAPIFVPMMMMTGIAPEATQAAYRIGDSVTNIISPLLPYLPVIIVFARRYDRKAGMGTIIATMLPYSIAFAIGWAVLLFGWLALDLPLGPGAQTWYAP